MRVYLPATHAVLRRLVADRVLPAPLSGYAVTPALRESYSDGDLEELEYAALTAAARASLGLLAAEPAAAVPPRRAVLAADLPDGGVRLAPGRHAAAVDVAADIRLRDVAAVHVDDPAAEQAVRVAVAQWAAAQGGDEDARFALDETEGFELQWWATQELDDVLSS